MANMNLADEIIKGHNDNVAKLLANGADINEFDRYGFTPLMEAAIANNNEIAELLIQQDADLKKQDYTGNTALHWAAENNNLELSKLLLNHRADPNAYSNSSQPVLLKPLLRGNHKLKELLYRYGADVNFAHDYLNTKLLGHRFELRGRAYIANDKDRFIEVEFEGFILEFTLSILCNSLVQFKHNYGARNLRSIFILLQRCIDAFENSCELIKYQHYQINIKKHDADINQLLSNELLLLPIGCQSHASAFIKLGKFFAKIDRGEYSRHNPSVVIYECTKPRLLNNKFFKSLLYRRQNKAYIDHGLIESLHLKPLTQLELPTQVSGNCSWANMEGTIPTMMLMLLMQHKSDPNSIINHKNLILSIYEQWHEWDKNRALTQSVESFYQARKARRMGIAASLAAVLFQKCHHTIKNDLEHASKILSVLSIPGYEQVLNSYLRIYTIDNKTDAGDNLLQLIDISGR